MWPGEEPQPSAGPSCQIPQPPVNILARPMLPSGPQLPAYTASRQVAEPASFKRLRTNGPSIGQKHADLQARPASLPPFSGSQTKAVPPAAVAAAQPMRVRPHLPGHGLHGAQQLVIEELPMASASEHPPARSAAATLVEEPDSPTARPASKGRGIPSRAEVAIIQPQGPAQGSYWPGHASKTGRPGGGKRGKRGGRCMVQETVVRNRTMPYKDGRPAGQWQQDTYVIREMREQSSGGDPALITCRGPDAFSKGDQDRSIRTHPSSPPAPSSPPEICVTWTVAHLKGKSSARWTLPTD